VHVSIKVQQGKMQQTKVQQTQKAKQALSTKAEGRIAG
jgi:hypothetical protein